MKNSRLRILKKELHNKLIDIESKSFVGPDGSYQLNKKDQNDYDFFYKEYKKVCEQILKGERDVQNNK